MMLIVVAVFGVISYRLVQLQVVGSERFEALALAQRLDTVPIDAERGSIFDREGRDLAISVRRESVWANPQVVTDPGGYAEQLAPIVGVDDAVLASRLAHVDKQFVYVARTVDDEVADAVRDLGLAGVDFLPESRRYYPAGKLAGPVLGVVGTDEEGLGGLEYLYDTRLAGKAGELVVERDRDGRAIPRSVQREIEAQRGTDLVLSVDEALQYEVEQSLSDQVTATSAEGGVAVVLDVRTGDVLAMASVVADENGVGQPAAATDRNRPVTDPFEPGSTSKLVTFAAALDAGVVGEWTPFEVPDWIDVADATFKDSEPHPTTSWSTAECFARSSNVCTIKVGQALGTEKLDEAFRAFGFGSPSELDFPGESSGLLVDTDEWYGTGLASASIGYGLSVTPLQMLSAYVTIANGGESRPPRLVTATIDPDGVRTEQRLAEGRRVVSSQAAASMVDLLVDVVDHGTGTCAAVPGYTVAGKTGTARKYQPPAGYSSENFFASFVGFAPAEDPRLAAIVVIDDPNWDHRYGGRAAAPVFSEVMQSALRMDRVPPPADSGGQWDSASAEADNAGIDCSVPHGGELDRLVDFTDASTAEDGAEPGSSVAEVNGQGLPADATMLADETSPSA